MPRPPVLLRAQTLTSYYLWACRELSRGLGFCACTGHHPDLRVPLKARANECHSVMVWCENHFHRMPEKARVCLGWNPNPIPTRMSFHRLFKSYGIKPEQAWSELADAIPFFYVNAQIAHKVPGLLSTLMYYTALFREYKLTNLRTRGNRMLQPYNSNMNINNKNIEKASYYSFVTKTPRRRKCGPATLPESAEAIFSQEVL